MLTVINIWVQNKTLFAHRQVKKDLKILYGFLYSLLYILYYVNNENKTPLEKRRKSCGSDNADEILGQQGMQNKSSSGRQMLHDLTYMKFKTDLSE